MKIRDWHEDAWELSRQHNQPGLVWFAEAAMKLGYDRAVQDFTKDMEQLKTDLVNDRTKANRPQ